MWLLKILSFRRDLSLGSFAWFFRWDVSLETSAWIFHWSLARRTFAGIFRGELPLGIECASRNLAALKVDGWFWYFCTMVDNGWYLNLVIFFYIFGDFGHPAL